LIAIVRSLIVRIAFYEQPPIDSKNQEFQMVRAPFIEVEQEQHTFMLTAIPASLLTQISYAAIRRQDDEEGAVQRVLNQSRISGIKAFAMQGGDFPTSIVLNWVDGKLNRNGNWIDIPKTARAAQIIDGQHRVAGILEALAERPELGKMLIPVAIYEGLNTVQCANIFLSINTEQKPVSRSLVFDLYGIASQERVDEAAVRARDIVLSLAEDGQAFSGLIKLPSSRRQKGGIQLATAVTAIKPVVAKKGTLEQIGAESLEIQKSIFQNYFNVLADKYGDFWPEKDNAFIYAAGFMGAIEFLSLKLIPYCNLRKSFTVETISDAIQIERGDLIRQAEVKGLGGKDAPKRVFDRMVSLFNPHDRQVSGFEV
jgi:DGQHR domain-containing protein